MRYLKVACLVVAFLLAAAPALTSDNRDVQPGAPHMKKVEPESAKVGDIVTASGEFLDSSRVADVYLTNGKVDLKAPIVEQKPAFIKIKIPAQATPGRFALMILLAGPDPKLLEQPVTVIVE